MLAVILTTGLAFFTAFASGGGIFRDTQSFLVGGVLVVLVFVVAVGASVQLRTVHLTFAALILVGVSSSYTSGWWMESLRESGLYLGYLVALFLGVNLVGGRRRRVALHAAVALGAAVAILGLYQHFTGYDAQIELLQADGLEAQARQLAAMSSAAFGNFPSANGFGGFMIMLIPVALGLAGYEKSIKLKLFSLMSAAVMGTALYYSFSRAAAFALLFGLAAAGLMWVWRSRRRFAAIAIITGTAFSTLLLFGLFFRFQLDRVAGVLEGRFELWRAAAAMIGDHPWLGVGAGGFGTAMSSYQTASVFSRYAHNSYLQVAAEIGIPGFLVFLALLAGVLLGIRRAYLALDGRASWLFLGLFAGLVAVAVHNAIDYTWYFPAVAFLFWWLAGLALGNEESAPSTGSAPGAGRIAAVIAILMAIIPFALVSVAYGTASVAREAYSHHVFELEREARLQPRDEKAAPVGPDGQAERHGVEDELQEIITAYDRSLELNPYDSDVYDSYARTLLEESERGHGGSLSRAARLQKKAIALRPDWPYYRLNLAQIMEASGDKEIARQSYQAAVDLGPKMPRLAAEAGYFELRESRPRVALEAFEKAIALEADYGVDLDFEDFQGGRGDVVNPLTEIGRAYRGAAYALIELGRYGQAAQALTESERLGGRGRAVDFAWGRVLEAQGDFVGAAAAYRRAAYVESGDHIAVDQAALLSLAMALEAAGDKTAAWVEAERLLKLAPQNPEALALIERLEAR